jgi:hypothetical protein
MPAGAACLLDTNILLRISKPDDPHHAEISHALQVLVGLHPTSSSRDIALVAVMLPPEITIQACHMPGPVPPSRGGRKGVGLGA